MAFIKNNLFLIALAVITLLVCGGLIGVYSHYGHITAAQISEREALAKKIRALGGPAGINAGALDSWQKYVEKVENSFKAFQDEFYKRNHANFTVFTLETGDQKIQVFPYNKEQWNRYSVPFLFPMKYKQEMAGLLERLGATTPPTQNEINDATRRIALLMAQEQKHEDQNAANAQSNLLLPPGVEMAAETTTDSAAATGAQAGRNTPPAARTGPPSTPPNMGPPPGALAGMMGMPGPMPGMNPPGASADVAVTGVDSAEAARRATESVKLQKAMVGPIYATDASFYYYQLPVGTQPTPDQMWMAQVSYWLQRDLVDSIVKTNDEVRRLKSPNQPLAASVPASGVKRLVSVSVNGYDGVGSATGGSFTKRQSNQTYDVVTYNITLVVDLRYLPTFIRNLESQNFNTVLDLRLSSISFAGSSSTSAMPGGAGGGGATAPEEMFYYGTDPVMRVTLKVESLLFCEWERPLMPSEMLRMLPAGTLRSQDAQPDMASMN